MDKNTIIRTAVLALALINQCLVMAGISPLPIDDATLTEMLTGLFTIGASVWCWFKNNSVTKEAQLADKVMHGLKDGSVVMEDAENLVK